MLWESDLFGRRDETTIHAQKTEKNKTEEFERQGEAKEINRAEKLRRDRLKEESKREREKVILRNSGGQQSKEEKVKELKDEEGECFYPHVYSVSGVSECDCS